MWRRRSGMRSRRSGAKRLTENAARRVERLVRRSSMSEGGSDTHQLHFTDMMGFARAQPILRPYGDFPVDKSLLAMTLANIRSPDGAKPNPGPASRESPDCAEPV